MRIEELSDKIYKLMKGYSYAVTMFDDDGMKTLSTTDATRFFVEKPNIMIRISIDAVTINKPASLMYDDIQDLAEQIKTLAHRNGYTFNVRVYGSQIVPKDFIHELKESKGSKLVGKLYGKKKTSYQKVGENTIIVYRHTGEVNERARTSKVSEIEITSNGEKYMLPVPNVNAARALAVYMENGGSWNDKASNLIKEAAERIRQVNQYRKYVRNTDPIATHLAGMTTKKINKAVSDFLHLDDDSTVDDILSTMNETISAGGVSVGAGAAKDNGPYSDKVLPLIKREKTASNMNKLVKKYSGKAKLPEAMVFEDDSSALDFIIAEMEASNDSLSQCIASHISDIRESYTDEDKAELLTIISNQGAA